VFQIIRLRSLLVIMLTMVTSCSVEYEEAATHSPINTQTTETIMPTHPATSTQITEPWRELDLRFAHVLEVSYTPLSETQVRFDVTLVHDDESEAPEFADWWQVEDLSADVLGMRILTHSHGSQPFTRSDTIDIPAGVELVIIRGHDMRHGFGGQAIQLNLVTGEQITLMPTQ